MAESAPEELARNIARNVVPFNAGQDLAGIQQGGEAAALRFLRMLGLLPPQQAAAGALPQMDEGMGRVLTPNELLARQIEVLPGDVDMRRLQQQIAAGAGRGR